MKRLFFLLLVFPIYIFAQYDAEYVYAADSILGYPNPHKFYPAQKRPESINRDDVRQSFNFSKEIWSYACERETVFRILVDEDGCYVKHLILRGHPLVIEAMSPCISELQFTPAIQNGKPIKFWMVTNFRFCKCQF